MRTSHKGYMFQNKYILAGILVQSLKINNNKI